jgi:hypothetical protein
MKWPVSECRIVGAMRPSEGAAPFARAGVVVEREALGFLRVRRYVLPDEVEGDLLTGEEWDGLVATEHAHRLAPPIGAVMGAALWLLRPSFERRDAALAELRSSGVLLSEVVSARIGLTWTYLVREPEANPLRERWSARAFAEANELARAGRWKSAHGLAEMAFALDPALSPDKTALLTLVYERLGDKARSEGYLGVARRSRGEAFAKQVEDKRKDIEQSWSASQQGPGLAKKSPERPRNAVAFQQRSREQMRQGLEAMAA